MLQAVVYSSHYAYIIWAFERLRTHAQEDLVCC